MTILTRGEVVVGVSGDVGTASGVAGGVERSTAVVGAGVAAGGGCVVVVVAAVFVVVVVATWTVGGKGVVLLAGGGMVGVGGVNWMKHE